ncbi:hypothetical protein ACKGJY_14310 [Hyunsoonleella sp. 2307UL5-6]|uniref:hypothetical protein n=1 Tax=Hyunsoonleella sp. 2307UL5-6 TaxID=3384768 RepID=UPI0039BD1D16
MNITYILGASVSFEALPIVNQIPEKLLVFANAFRINNFEFMVLNEQKSNIAEKHLHLYNLIEDRSFHPNRILN